ncbi:uncharacterized protein LOC123200019 isoform X2 [Mangifera indica]|uniref:uncharacterized protein LOC123200019 isoform X2 n=1 Tax=Mangifera indica TaxID=29780 RepID=UPI001CF99556|nr:uncharacterized protein LOC123200019 isoform X2 [Mangifera indica]
MSTVLVHRPQFFKISHDGYRNHRKSSRIATVRNMTMDSKSSGTSKKEDLSTQVLRPVVPQLETLGPSDLKFDRLQPSDQELVHHDRFQFGKFVAREAVLDEEYWTAAWLRAESLWEGRTNERYVDNYKRKFAEQEFNDIKRRCRGQHGQKYLCIVTERVMAPPFGCINKTDPNRYGYIANLCVAKSARRQGIASNMLHFAIVSAKSNDVDQLYVHVHRNNKPALELYQKMGFELSHSYDMVGMGSSQFLEHTDLLCIRM